jgi:hypothetical protein
MPAQIARPGATDARDRAAGLRTIRSDERSAQTNMAASISPHASLKNSIRFTYILSYAAHPLQPNSIASISLHEKAKHVRVLIARFIKQILLHRCYTCSTL